MQRILVIRGGAIGDFILTLPAIKLLRDAFPQARLEILGYRHIAALAENRFYAQAIRSIEYAPLAGFFAKGGELNAELSGYFASFDLVVSYLFDPDGIFERNVVSCGVEMFIAAPPKVTDGEHAARQLARPLEHVGLTLQDPAVELFPSREDRDSARRLVPDAAGVVAVHPGSGSATKNWPIERWNALAERLSNRPLLIVGGEADERQIAALPVDGARLAINLPLPQLAAVLKRCELFIGHDSGISHIAAAVGTPCILMFGPTNPHVWAPANRAVHVIRPASADLKDISVEQVLDAVAARPVTS